MSRWEGLGTEVFGVRKACGNLESAEEVASYIYDRVSAYQGSDHEEATEALIAAALKHWRSRLDAGDDEPRFLVRPSPSALLDDHAQLYASDPYFKLLVDTLIPLMLDALAMKSNVEREKVNNMVREIMETRDSFFMTKEASEKFDEMFGPDE